MLLYHNPLSETAKQRLGIMRESNDGFYIAEKDLAIRGPGEILGTRQTGLMAFRIADLLRDSYLQPKVKLWQEMQGYVGNVDVLQQGARGGGFFYTTPDVDGVISSSPLFMQFQNRHYPSFALDMARLFYFEDPAGHAVQGSAGMADGRCDEGPLPAKIQ